MTIDDLIAALTLEPLGDHRYRGANLRNEHGVVFGGQLIAQSVGAATASADGKSVQSVHTVFVRSAAPDAPLEVEVVPLHAGRTVATTSVSIVQGDRLCTQSLVVLSATDRDFIRHGDRAPDVAAPGDGIPLDDLGRGWQVRAGESIDLMEPDAVGPPNLDLWLRFDGAPDDPALAQALLAYASEGFVIGTSMRPHAGVGLAMAHRMLSTAVLTLTITYHEPFSAREWLLLTHHSSYAGRGRAYGGADVFRSDGQLVASFTQAAMIRPLGEAHGGRL
jgi:acyl-CoA thioesterase